MGQIREIVFESEMPSRLARFWVSLLEGYAIRAYDDTEIARLAGLGFTPETDPTVMVDGPGPSLCFQKVAGRHYDNNRVHLDIAVADVGAAVAKAEGNGAKVQRVEPGYTVMADPEGNQFCLIAQRQRQAAAGRD